MNRQRVLLAATVLLLTVGCSSADAGGTSGESSPPPGAPDLVKRYVEALNDRDVKGLLEVGAAPDKPWSRKQAAEIIQSRGGKGLTIAKAPIRYERMGDYMGKAALTTSDTKGRTLRETVDLIHDKSHWHVVLFKWPNGDKESSKS